MRMLVCQKYPARDRVRLAADVYLPDGPGPFPVILCRTPYDRVAHLGPWARAFVERGYAYVAADCRGRFESEGVFARPFDEAADGQATVDWVANERWCNGRIGLWGRSYGGLFQVPAAIGGHEAVRCICPSIVMARFFQEWCRYDGCFALKNPLWWVMGHGTGRTAPPSAHVDWNRLAAMRPGEPTRIRLHLSQLAYTFPAGSRIGLMVTSSDFPRILPHPNTMAKPWEPVEPVVAHTRVLHGGGLACALELPVVDGL